MKTEEFVNQIQLLLLPTIILLSAYIFHWVSRLGHYDELKDIDRHNSYLYIFTACAFWPNLFFVISNAVFTNVDKYFPQKFQDIVTELERTLNSIDEPNTAVISMEPLLIARIMVLIAFFSWTGYAIFYFSNCIQRVWPLRPKRRIWHIYRGRSKVIIDVLLANFSTSIIVGISIYALGIFYAYTSAWFEPTFPM